MDLLKCLHEIGCPWGQSTCRKAAEGGHLDVLKYARAYRCPMDRRFCQSIAEARGHHKVAEWLEHHCLKQTRFVEALL